MINANITGGAYHGSQLVSVSATGAADGSTILIYRGALLMGQGLLSGGSVNIITLALSNGDIIQASVNTRGNYCGYPVIVVPGGQPTGWLHPTDVLLNSDENGTEEILDGDIGIALPSVYDPQHSGLTLIPPEYIAADIVELGFDVEQLMLSGKTTVRVVPRGTEALLVGWNGAQPSSPASISLTASATITVTVQRDDSGSATLTRSINVTVLPAVTTTTVVNGSTSTTTTVKQATDITSAAWRNMGNYYIRAMVNCLKNVEGQLVGYSPSTEWKAGTMRETGFNEIDWSGPVPTGTYTCLIRVVGETNSANYTSFIVNVI